MQLASQEIFSQDGADEVDGVTRARASWLGRRCSRMLAHDKVPKSRELKFEAVPVLRPKVHRQGPNKSPELGHTWTITSSAKNLRVQCQVCSLFAQQTDPAPLVDFVLSHPCKGFKASPAANCNTRPSHSIENLGSVWRCAVCLCSSSVTCGGLGKTVPDSEGRQCWSRSKFFPAPSHAPKPKSSKPKMSQKADRLNQSVLSFFKSILILGPRQPWEEVMVKHGRTQKGQGRGSVRRSSCSLPNKSVGSISTIQRRSAAYHAAQSSTPAELIQEPVAPPPPPGW